MKNMKCVFLKIKVQTCKNCDKAMYALWNNDKK